MVRCDDTLVNTSKNIQHDPNSSSIKRWGLEKAISQHYGPENDTNTCQNPPSLDKTIKKRLKIIGDIMKIYKYISIFLLYLFIYIILFIINPWILELINITITLPWSIIEEDIITHLGLNLNPTIDNIFYRRIIHFAYGSISFFINIFLLYKLIYKLKKIFKLYKIN